MSKQASAALLSRRYAKALFELASGANAVDAVLKNIDGLEVAAKSPSMQVLMHNPLIGTIAQRKAVDVLKSTLNLQPLVQQFLNTLVLNRRLAVLPEALEHFIELARAARGESLVVITSAKPLDEKSRAALRAKLEQKLGKIAMDERVDASLLAGVVIQKGSHLLDASLKGRLNTLKVALS